MSNKQAVTACVVLLIVGYGYAKAVNYKDCGSVTGKINALDLSPCDADPCVLTKGNIYTATVNFTSTKTIVHGIIKDVPVPFPVPADACNNHNMKCPVVAGATDVYVNSIYCSPEYPAIRLIVKWEVQDDNGKDLFCFEVPLSIA